MSGSKLLAAAFMAAALAACHGARTDKTIAPVRHVDLARYMGSWYVIASIPTRFGSGGYNPVETYACSPTARSAPGFASTRSDTAAR
jgi:apolipoprotein D and lipocalin family protein